MADRDKIILDIEANDNASDKLKNVSKSIRDVSKEANSMNTGSNKINDVVKGIEHYVSKFNTTMRQYNNAMSPINRNVMRGIREVGREISDFTKDAIDNFTKFSEQHAKTLGAMSADYDNSAASQKKFFEDAQKLKEQAIQYGMYGFDGNGSLVDISGVSQAQEALIKAGVSSKDIVNTNVTKDVLTFAQANDLTTDQAVDTAVSLGNQFNIDKSKWGEMLDKVSHTADMSIVEVSDIVTSLKWASGISAGLGRSFDETLGMLSTLGDFGLKGSQAGTGVQALLTRLLTGDTTVITDAQAKVAPGNALKKFYEFEKAAKPDGNLLPMSDVIDKIDETMKDMTDEEQAWFAKKLFGLYQMKSAYALINGDDADLNEVIQEIKKQSSGTNQRKLQQLLDSQYGQLTTLNNLWEGVKTDVGDRLSPIVSAIRDELFKFLKNDGNYDINFDNIRKALDESCDLIEKQYGKAIANAVRNMGEFTIDLSEVSSRLAPEFLKGLDKTFGSLFKGDIFGKNGMMANWEQTIDNMKESTSDLSPELQELGDTISETIKWFGRLMTLNVATQIAELITSALKLLTIAGGAIINISGAVVVNGNGTGTGTGKGGSVGGDLSKSSKGAKGTKAKGTKGKGTKALDTVDDVADDVLDSADDVANSADDVARGLGKLSGFGKMLGAAATALQVYLTANETIDSISNKDYKGATESVVGGASSIGGGTLGASIGTAIAPGFGTVLGAIIGSKTGDSLGRDVSGSIYDIFNDAQHNYGTWTAGLPLVGDKIKSKGTITQQKDQKLREENAEKYFLPSNFDLPKIFDKYVNTSDLKIPFNAIINDLSNSVGVYRQQMESRFGMTAKEAEKWQNSREYKEYLKYINDVKDGYKELNNALKDNMSLVKKGDKSYNKDLDKTGQGYYTWNGDEKSLQKYLNSRGNILVGEDYAEKKKIKGATEDNPYLVSSLKQAVKEGISESNKENSGNKGNKKTTNIKDPLESKSIGQILAESKKNKSNTSENTSIKSNNTNLVGNLSIPNFSGNLSLPNMSNIFKRFIPGLGNANPLANKKDLIKNEINTQTTVNDNINMQPRFSVAAPNVNVNVKVDKENRVTKEISILNPQQGVLLDNWYSRVTSQYGRFIK